MNWTTPEELKVQVQRLWDRGDLLRALVSDAVSWPLRLNLKTPRATDLSDHFEAVREWAHTIAAIPQLRIELVYCVIEKAPSECDAMDRHTST